MNTIYQVLIESITFAENGDHKNIDIKSYWLAFLQKTYLCHCTPLTALLNCQEMLASLKRPLGITMVNTTNLRKTFYAFVGLDPSALLNNGLHTHTCKHTRMHTHTHPYVCISDIVVSSWYASLPSSISFLITRIHHNLHSQVQTPFSP